MKKNLVHQSSKKNLVDSFAITVSQWYHHFKKSNKLQRFFKLKFKKEFYNFSLFFFFIKNAEIIFHLFFVGYFFFFFNTKILPFQFSNFSDHYQNLSKYI